VVALRLRSAARTSEAALPADAEMDYAITLNRALPDDIRVLGWAPVPDPFSARQAAAFAPTLPAASLHNTLS
jgi:tRNA pseudouridine38/39 synthase